MIREKIEKILLSYMSDTLNDGKDRPLVRRGIRETAIKDILEAVRAELPKKSKLRLPKKGEDFCDRKCIGICDCSGFNEALDLVHTLLT